MEGEVEARTREGRRRKIMERGSDRMASITGHLKTLDSPSFPSSSSLYSSSTHNVHHLHTQSLPNSFFRHQSVASPDVDLKGEDGNDLRSKVEPQLQKCKTLKEAVRETPSMEDGNKLQRSSAITTAPKSSNGGQPILRSNRTSMKFYTPKEISSSILSTENMRVFCSITVALLVVLSNVSLPRAVVKKSIVASKPLYVVLVTDAAIVIARLTLERWINFEHAKEEEEHKGKTENTHIWGGAVRILELGLVVHQTVRAIFIDCSFCMVIVICGLSLL